MKHFLILILSSLLCISVMAQYNFEISGLIGGAKYVNKGAASSSVTSNGFNAHVIYKTLNRIHIYSGFSIVEYKSVIKDMPEDLTISPVIVSDAKIKQAAISVPLGIVYKGAKNLYGIFGVSISPTFLFDPIMYDKNHIKISEQLISSGSKAFCLFVGSDLGFGFKAGHNLAVEIKSFINYSLSPVTDGKTNILFPGGKIGISYPL